VKASERLRELRARLGITIRDVQGQSEKIAEAQGNAEFYISNAWLTRLENTDRVPSIQKLISLSVIYKVQFSELLRLFGIDLEHIGERRFDAPPQQTYLLTVEGNNPERRITVPVQLHEGANFNETNLLARIVEQWGELPLGIVQQLNFRHNQYGFIGLQDFTLYPILRPGSFVQIDSQLRRIQSYRWRTEFDRPIYFLELRDSYACGWCEVRGHELTLVPHPLSPCPVTRFEFPREVEIVGQVTGVAMRLMEHPSDAVTAKVHGRATGSHS
jgi:transcriptional regulator with XRE-family HTH domain